MTRLRLSPIEEHMVQGRIIRVKRDDLCAPEAFPPLGKIRGLPNLLDRLRREGFRNAGVFESACSQVGLTLALACKEYDEITAHVFFVQTTHRKYSRSARQAKELGATLVPLRQNVLNVCYGQARRIMTTVNGYMVPFGFEYPEAKLAVSMEASTVPSSFIEGGSLVVSAGSGLTICSILNGLGCQPSRAIAVSTGRSPAQIQRCLDRNLVKKSVHVEIVGPEFLYHQPASAIAPFPCDPWYDLKAWDYLTRNIAELPEPIFFWNVGA